MANVEVIRNPKWTRDEIILALDLYFKLDSMPNSENHEGIIELSKFLKRLPIYSKSEVNDRFRNANGVYMKLLNLANHDPNYPGVGVPAGSAMDEQVWIEFAEDVDVLHTTANAIRSNYATITEDELKQFKDNDEEEFKEGRILTRAHKQRERNSSLVKKKKRKILKEEGKLACECCQFDFKDFYGDIGDGFAECHHKLPVASLAPNSTIRLSDLAIVCANCHRIIHRSKPMLSVESLRKIILARRGE